MIIKKILQEKISSDNSYNDHILDAFLLAIILIMKLIHLIKKMSYKVNLQ